MLWVHVLKRMVLLSIDNKINVLKKLCKKISGRML